MSESIDLTTRRGALFAALAAGVGVSALASRANAELAAVRELSPTVEALIAASGAEGGVHDWDYLMGDWTAVNRRMKKRWTGNPEWDEFPATTTYVQFMGGLVNVDDTEFPTRGFGGVTLRAFSPEKKRWSIYWINSRDGVVTAPMVGAYSGNVGHFYGDDVDDGVPIVARFIRTKKPPNEERWEQAFSKDGGKTWETNWTADFTRVKRA
jgi:hypothetical protein